MSVQYHIHAVYNEYEVLIVIESGEIYAEHLPGNSDWALDVFYQLNPNLK